MNNNVKALTPAYVKVLVLISARETLNVKENSINEKKKNNEDYCSA